MSKYKIDNNQDQQCLDKLYNILINPISLVYLATLICVCILLTLLLAITAGFACRAVGNATDDKSGAPLGCAFGLMILAIILFVVVAAVLTIPCIVFLYLQPPTMETTTRDTGEC